MKRTHVCLIVVTLSCIGISLVAFPAKAAVVANESLGAEGAHPVSADDLINQGQSSFSSSGFVGTDAFGDGVGSLNNGSAYHAGIDNTNGSLTPAAGGVATFELDTSINTLGYTIDSIVSLTGFSGGARTGQHYEIAVSLVNDPGFTNLTTVSFPGDAGNLEREITVEDDLAIPLATGVDALQFTFLAGTDFEHLVYREFDVFGSAVVIPEPTGFMLATIGFVVTATRARRRKR